MFGLDNALAGFSDGTTLLLVFGIALLLGLRHAADPDHLAAVTTLSAGDGRSAAKLGLAWGLGHASTLFAFGLPIVLYRAYLPERVQQGAEVTVGLMIAALAVLLLRRWRHGAFGRRTRTRLGAFAIGLVHGTGGSAGVGILLLASIHGHGLAVASLALFAGATALSMTVLSGGFGRTLGSLSIARIAPVLGLASLAFGVWYALGALDLAPYVF
jgi:High-affinity nickel-transport protein